MKKVSKTQTQENSTASDELMDIAKTVIARLDGLWFSAFTEQVVAEINHLRDAEKRAKVEEAGKVAHEAAAASYVATYRRVLREVMDASA